jgi:hypothetical protein
MVSFWECDSASLESAAEVLPDRDANVSQQTGEECPNPLRGFWDNLPCRFEPHARRRICRVPMGLFRSG